MAVRLMLLEPAATNDGEPEIWAPEIVNFAILHRVEDPAQQALRGL